MWHNDPSTYRARKLTLELRDIVDNGENSVDIWEFDYPSFYEGQAKKDFEKKVIDHFYFRQLGHETVGRWLHYFRAKVREIMPYYIELYESVQLLKNQGDPLESYNLTETYQRTATSSGESSSTGTSSSKLSSESNDSNTESRERRFSNTPKGRIENLDQYMSEASKEANTNANEGSASSETESESSGSSSSSGSNNEEYTLTRRGNIGVQPLGQEIMAYRQALINVDMKIIDELDELFLQVY